MLLALGGISARFGREVGAPHLKLHLEEAIRSALPRGKREMAMLETHTTSPYPGHDADVETRWEWVKQSKFELNQAKARQLIICADLMSQFPEKLMLKKPLDPLQDSPRKNLEHAEDQLRYSAKLALQNHTLLFRNWNQYYACKLAIDNIELVPHDRYLWFFMDTLARHPPADYDVADEESQYIYPPEIAAGLSVVMKGLSFVYTGYPALIVPKIRWGGRRLATGPDALKPAFDHDPKNHSHDLAKTFHRCGVNRVMIYDEREYEWLRAFLTVVTWMEKKLGTDVPVLVEGKESEVITGL